MLNCVNISTSTYQECCCTGWKNEHHKYKYKGKINDQIQIQIRKLWECILPGARNEHHTLLSVAGASTIPGSATSTTPPVFLSNKIQIQIKSKIWTHLFNCKHNVILIVHLSLSCCCLRLNDFGFNRPNFHLCRFFMTLRRRQCFYFVSLSSNLLISSHQCSVCLPICRISQLLRLQLHQIFSQPSSFLNFHENSFFGEMFDLKLSWQFICKQFTFWLSALLVACYKQMINEKTTYSGSVNKWSFGVSSLAMGEEVHQSYFVLGFYRT